MGLFQLGFVPPKASRPRLRQYIQSIDKLIMIIGAKSPSALLHFDDHLRRVLLRARQLNGENPLLRTQLQSSNQRAIVVRAVQRYLLKVIENMDLRPPRAAA